MKSVVPSGFILAIMLIAVALVCWGQTTQRTSAFALEQQGKNAEAETVWREILKTHPNNAEAYAHLGLLEARQKYYSKAVFFYRKALALDPSMPGLQLNLGLSLFKVGELKQAIRVFEPLLKRLPPDSPDAQRLRILLGMAHYGLSEYGAAVPYLKDAMAHDPQNLPYRLVLAQSCLRSRQFPCVLQVYHQILLLDAESAEADMLAGEALDEMRDHADAIMQFRAAVKADPNEPEVHFGLGYLLWGEKDYEQAAGQFQAQLDLVPDDADAMAYLADSDIRLNNPAPARPLIEKAIRINPRLELLHLDLGILDANAGDKNAALREFKVAATLDPTDVQPHWRLARLYRSMGRNEEAKAESDRTRTLIKTANESVFKKIQQAQARGKTSDAATAASAPQ